MDDDDDDELSWQLPKQKKQPSKAEAWTIVPSKPNKPTPKWSSPTPATPKVRTQEKKPAVQPKQSKQSKNRYAMPGSFSAGLMGMDSSEAGSSDAAELEIADLDLTPEKPQRVGGTTALDDSDEDESQHQDDDGVDAATAMFSKITITGPKTPNKETASRRSSAATLTKKHESDEEEEEEEEKPKDAASVFGNIMITGPQPAVKPPGAQKTTNANPVTSKTGELGVKSWSAGGKHYAEMELPISWELLIKNLKERGFTVNRAIIAQRTHTMIKIADNEVQRQLKIAGDTEQSVANALTEINNLLGLLKPWGKPKPVPKTPVLADLAKLNQKPPVHTNEKPVHVLPWPFPEQSRSPSRNASRSRSRGARHMPESRQRPVVPQPPERQMTHRDAQPRPPSQSQFANPGRSGSIPPRQTNLSRGGRVDATPTRRPDFRDARPRNTTSASGKPRSWNRDLTFAKERKTTAANRIKGMAVKDREAYLLTLRTVPMPPDAQLIYKGLAWPESMPIELLGSESAKDELSDLDRLRGELDCHVALLSKGYQAFLDDEDDMLDQKVRGALVVAGREEDNVMIAFERLKLFRGQCSLETQESDHRILVRAPLGSCPTVEEIERLVQESPRLFNRPIVLNDTEHFQTITKRSLLLVKRNLFRMPDEDDDAAVIQLRKDCARSIIAFGQEQLDTLSTYCGKVKISLDIGSVFYSSGFRKNAPSTLIEFAKQAREPTPLSARLCRVTTSDHLYARLLKAGHLLTDLSSFGEHNSEGQPVDLSKVEPNLALEIFGVNGHSDLSFEAKYEPEHARQCHETVWSYTGLGGKRSSSAMVTSLESGFSWSLSFEHQRYKYKAPPKSSEQMSSNVEYVGHDVHVYDAPDLEKLFKIHSSHRGPFIQKVIWQFRLRKLEDYIVELTRYDLFESPSPQRPNNVPNTSVQCEWGLSILQERWADKLAQNRVSPIGEPAGWEPNLDTFFPSARNSPEKKQNGAGMRDLINAVNELVDFLNKTDGT